jgi:tripartite-type tricarboxylate transporter receptor subunit TctC
MGAVASRHLTADATTLTTLRVSSANSFAAPTGTLITLHPHVFQNLGYDPLVDLEPVSQIVQSDLALAAGPNTPVQSLGELITWLRSNPAQATYGSPGTGTSSHLAATEFARQSNLDLRHIPYRGSGAAMPDLLGGRLPLYIAATPELIEHHRAGKLRIIATTGVRRSPLLPDVPTFSEQGFSILAPVWFAVYGAGKDPATCREAPQRSDCHRRSDGGRSERE